MVRNAGSRHTGIPACRSARVILLNLWGLWRVGWDARHGMVPCTAKGSCRCKGIHGSLPIAWDTLEEKGLQKRPIQQTIPSAVSKRVGKISQGNTTYAWPVLSAPSRCLPKITTGKRRWGAASCSESIKPLLCFPAECEHRVLTVTAVCCSPCCWGTIWSLPCRYFFFPYWQVKWHRMFEVERAILGRTGKNPGINFFRYRL